MTGRESPQEVLARHPRPVVKREEMVLHFTICYHNSTVLPNQTCPQARGFTMQEQASDPAATATVPTDLHCLITGGSGFIGRHLASRLREPRILSRNPARIQNPLPTAVYRQWDCRSLPDPALFENIDTVFHLAGESVFRGRWTRARKERILESRVSSTRLLVQAMAGLERPPATLVCASAIGYYGDRGDELLDEDSGPGEGFLARVCQQWENEAMRAERHGIRTVCIRTGIVLGADGGALPRMLTAFRLGLGGRLGNGDQYMSWIHVRDLTGIMLHCAAEPSCSGPVNGVAPGCVTNREFTATLAAALHRPALLPVPGFLLRLLLGEFAGVLLSSQRVRPGQALASGYRFRHPDLAGALEATLSGRG